MLFAGEATYQNDNVRSCTLPLAQHIASSSGQSRYLESFCFSITKNYSQDKIDFLVTSGNTAEGCVWEGRNIIYGSFPEPKISVPSNILCQNHCWEIKIPESSHLFYFSNAQFWEPERWPSDLKRAAWPTVKAFGPAQLFVSS